MLQLISKEIPCLIWVCCSFQSQIYMHSIVPLLICLTSLIVFPMLNLPLTIFSMCPGISEGQTFAIFWQPQPSMASMIHQFQVLLVTRKNKISISLRDKRMHDIEYGWNTFGNPQYYSSADTDITVLPLQWLDLQCKVIGKYWNRNK